MIKKCKPILIVLLFLQITSFGQTGFDKIYSFSPNPSYSIYSQIRSIYADTQSIFISGLTFRDTLDNNVFSSFAAFLAAVDYSGNIQWQKRLVFSLPLYQATEPNLFHLLKKVRPGKYVLGAQGWDCTNLYPACIPRPFLYFFNQNGDSLQFVSIPFGSFPEVNFFYSLMVDQQKNILATGLYINNVSAQDTSGIWLSKFDSTGNFLWRKVILHNQDASIRIGAYKVINGNDNQHYILGGLSGGMDSVHTFFSVWKTDTVGNVIWQKSIPKATPFIGPIGDQFFDIIPSVSGNGYYFLAAEARSSGGSAIYYCGKLDDDGEVVWAKTYQRDSLHSEKIYGLKQKPNGDLLFMGGTNGYVTPEAIQSTGPSLFCTDSLGNIKWFKVTKRYDCPELVAHFTYAMDLTPNGGIVRGGWIGQFNGQPGCYDSTDAIAWLVLSDSLGQRDPEDTITYPVRVDSIIFPKGEDTTRIVHLPQGNPASFRMYPNPTKDKVNIEVFALKASELELSLYDQIGKLLWRRKLHQNREEIDLSGYAPGLYYFRLRQNGKDLGGEKLIKR